jgi:hypothetical protein
VSDLNILIGSAAFALFVGLLTSALQLAGVISVNVARVLLTAAWAVAVLGVCGSMQNAPAKDLLLAAVVTGIPVGIGLIVVERWMTRKVSPKASKPTDGLKPPRKPSNLQFVRARIEHVSLDGDIPRKIRPGSPYSHVAFVAVFESELTDIELRAAITFNDPSNSQVDRACWLYEKSHIARLKRGERKELLIGYKQENGFVCVENYYDRDRSIKVKLLNGKELIANVRLLSSGGPTETQRHKFQITIEPELAISRIDASN